MTSYQNTMPCGVARRVRGIVPFEDTLEAKERRETRRTIRMADCLNRNERDTLLYIVNLWFVHRRKEGFIHPGVEKIAAKVALSVRSVKSFLSRFREMGFLKAIAFAKGGRKATRYTLDFAAMHEAIDPHGVETVPGDLTELEQAKDASNSGQSSAENGSAENVKTVQKLHTVIDSVHRIVLASCDRVQSAATHPAFAAVDDTGPDLARNDNQQVSDPYAELAAFLEWLGEAA